jgi:hypothetical protein
MTEWSIYEVVVATGLPQYIQLSSIQQLENRAAAKVKFPVDPSKPKVFYGKSLPDAAYVEDLNVYDCTKPATAIADESIFDKSGNLLYHYKWADPQYLNLAIGTALPPGSVGLAATNIACHNEVGTPLVSKSQLAEMKFKSLSSTVSGDGEIFFGTISQPIQNLQDQKEIIFIIHNNADHNINEFLPKGVSIPDAPNFRTEVDHVLLKCNENKFATAKIEQWSATMELVRLGAIDLTLPINFSDFKPFSPYAALQEIFCGKGYGGIGITFKLDNDSIKVTKVFSGSPAEKAGVKVDDIITHINSDSVGGLTSEQIIDEMRGPANSKIFLTILRGGQDNPLEVTVNREIIQRHSTQEGPSK